MLSRNNRNRSHTEPCCVMEYLTNIAATLAIFISYSSNISEKHPRYCQIDIKKLAVLVMFVLQTMSNSVNRQS